MWLTEAGHFKYQNEEGSLKKIRIAKGETLNEHDFARIFKE